jgi:hypothetical protein
MRRHEVPERHQRVIRALSAGGPAAPDTLRVPRPVVRPAPRRSRRTPALVAVAATAALAVFVVLATTAGGGPEVDAFARISQQPATKATPAGNGTVLDREFEGVAYPDWSGEFGWHADGGRGDTIEGRRAETVFYTHHGHRIAYTVIAGEPLEPPDGARELRVGGVTLHHFSDGPRDVVVFERGGHTCVLAGEVIHGTTVEELAAWRGDGAVDF